MTEGRRPAGEYSRYERKMEMLKGKVKVLYCKCRWPRLVRYGRARRPGVLPPPPKCEACGKMMPPEAMGEVDERMERNREVARRAAEKYRLKKKEVEKVMKEAPEVGLVGLSGFDDFVTMLKGEGDVSKGQGTVEVAGGSTLDSGADQADDYKEDGTQ